MKSTIQNVAGNSHPTPKPNPRHARDRNGWSAISRSKATSPTMANGHHPHGGIDNATRPPAASEPAAAHPLLRAQTASLGLIGASPGENRCDRKCRRLAPSVGAEEGVLD